MIITIQSQIIQVFMFNSDLSLKRRKKKLDINYLIRTDPSILVNSSFATILSIKSIYGKVAIK